jgi:membrane protease subunit HflC
MQAYETGLRQSDTRMVLSPTSEFFRYFNDPTGKGSFGGPGAPNRGAPAGSGAPGGAPGAAPPGSASPGPAPAGPTQ